MLSSNTSAANGAANYIEDVFSTWLYTGNAATQTITNGIDLAGKGGLVWCKERPAPSNHYLIDTVRGVGNNLKSNTTDAQQAVGLNSFTSTGFTTNSFLNDTGSPYASWTFRKQPKFFDVVTWTGNGANRTIAHSLGSVPGCIIVKRTDNTDNWIVYHRSLGNDNELFLNLTYALNYTNDFNFTTPTSTVFSVNGNDAVNASGGTYVAYLFAHNAGGFGLTGTDNVISCGTFTADASETASVTLGYEPQWLLFKPTSTTGDWQLVDTMRRWPVASDAYSLKPNTSAAEGNFGAIKPNATGFYATSNLTANATYIYIAIRRGPMAVPTTGTSVFSPYAATTPGNAVVTTGFPVDFQMQKNAGASTDMRFVDRLRGVSTTPTSPSSAFPFLVPSDTTAESTGTGTTLNWDNTGFTVGSTYSGSAKAWAVNFRRAPSFFDEVCYTGTGSARTVAHNLAAVPELMIVKSRSTVNSWPVWNPDVFAIDNGYITLLNSTIAVSNSGTSFNSTAPTSTVFTVGTNANTNGSGVTYVAYLFSSCPGVSKVGSYTGTGTTQQINCGFTGGARFVLIKRIASAGGAPAGADWYVWDSARGIVAGNDPYLLLNSTAAEVTGTDYVDTYSAGFEISSTAPAEINASGGTFIYLAIA